MRGWAEEMHATGQQEWGRLREWASSIAGMTLPAMEEQFDWARQQRDRFDEYVMPQMQSLFSEAETYASKAQEDLERGKAIQDVKAASEAQRQAQLRNLESYGIDPSDTRHAALDKQARLGEAAVSALAANQAGERTKQIGRNLRSEAINQGRTYLQDASGAYAGGTQTGATGVGAATGATATGAQLPGMAIPMMGGALAGTGQGAGIIDTSYGRALDYTTAENAARQQDFDRMMAVGQSIGQLTPVGALGGIAKTAEGGAIAAPGGPTDDAGAVAISDGEYVIPADVVKRLGTNHFDKMIEKETGRPPPIPKQAVPIPMPPPVSYQRTQAAAPGIIQ